MVTFVAVPYQLYALTHSALQVGLLSLAGPPVDLLERRGDRGTRARGNPDRRRRRPLDVRDRRRLVWRLAARGLADRSCAPRGEVPRAGLESLREGLRFLFRQPAILGTLVLDTNAMVFGMPQALFPAIAVHHFDAGAGAVGLLYSAPSAGALLAALASGWTGRLRRQGIGVAVAIVVWGLAIAGFGLATALWIGVVMLAIAGLADEYSATLRSTILFASTPDQMRGRMQASSSPRSQHARARQCRGRRGRVPDHPAGLRRLRRDRLRGLRGRERGGDPEPRQVRLGVGHRHE
jgi:hypothetical protein